MKYQCFTMNMGEGCDAVGTVYKNSPGGTGSGVDAADAPELLRPLL